MKGYSHYLKRWALARNERVKNISSLFVLDKSRVEYLEDVDCVLLHRDLYDQIVKNKEKETKLSSFIDRHLLIVEKMLDVEESKLRERGRE